MKNLRLHSIEHSCFFVKTQENFVYIRTRTLCNKCNIFHFTLTFYFYSPGNIEFLLLCTIKPSQEEPCPLRLVAVSRTTDIKQNIGVLPKEFLYDTNQCLCYLFVARRSLSVNIPQIKPICCEIRIGIIVKVNSIGKPVFSSEHKESIVIFYIIWRMFVDSVSEKFIHDLDPLQIIVTRFCRNFFAMQTFGKFSIHFFLPSFFALTCCVQPRKDFFLSSYWTVQVFCFHDDNFLINSTAKVTIKTEKTK